MTTEEPIIKEVLSGENIDAATQLILELWPECSYNEEYANCTRILKSKKEIIYLSRFQNEHTGFIYLSLRTDYVEGTTTSPVAYIEGLYIKPEYRAKGIGTHMVKWGEEWGKAYGAKEYASDTELKNSLSIDFHTKIGFNEVNRTVSFVKKIN